MSLAFPRRPRSMTVTVLGALFATALWRHPDLSTKARAQNVPSSDEVVVEAPQVADEPLVSETSPGSEAESLTDEPHTEPPSGDVFEDEGDVDDSVESEDDYPSFGFSGRLLTGAEYRKTHPTESQVAADSRLPFFLQHARVKMRVQLHKRVHATFSANLNSDPPIRSAFVQVKLHRALKIRVGRFKRPISRVELTSRDDLPFRERGIFNDIVLEDAGWGDRALGMRFSGKLKKPKLRYYVSVMNGSEWVDVRRVEQRRGADFLGRLEYRPLKRLRIAINGGHKLTEVAIDGPNVRVSAFGGDVYLRVGGFRWVIESIAAQNTYPPTPPTRNQRTPWAMNVISYATYDATLWRELELQPLLLAEWVDTDLDVAQDETLRVVAGLNWLWDNWFRVLPQVEVTRPMSKEVALRSQLKAENYYLMLAVEI